MNEQQMRRAVATGVSLALLRAALWLGVLGVLGVAALCVGWILLKPI